MKQILPPMSLLLLGMSGLVLCQDVHPLEPGTNVISDKLAAGTVTPGDILELAPGKYIEQVAVQVPFALTIRGSDDTDVTWYVADGVDAVYPTSDLRLENIIFLTDTTTPWEIVNDTLVATRNYNVAIANRAADTNNIIIDRCQFIGFGHGILADDSYDLQSACPMDSLVVTNSLFYGGPRYKMFRGIWTDYGLVRVLIVEQCTFWKIEGAMLRVYGHDVAGMEDYFHAFIDHNTFVDAGFPGPGQQETHNRTNTTGDGIGIYLRYTDADDTVRNNLFFDIADYSYLVKNGYSLETYVNYNISDTSGWDCEPKPTCYPLIFWVDSHGLEFCCNIEGVGLLLLADPDNGNFTLQEGSLAIGTASDGTDRGNNVITRWSPGTWSVLGVEQRILPLAFLLHQNYPNPFNPVSMIQYDLPNASEVSLIVYDILGREVARLVDSYIEPGYHQAQWNGRNASGRSVPSGIYIARLSIIPPSVPPTAGVTPEYTKSIKMLLLK